MRGVATLSSGATVPDEKNTPQAPTLPAAAGSMCEHPDQAKRRALLTLLFSFHTGDGGNDE